MTELDSNLKPVYYILEPNYDIIKYYNDKILNIIFPKKILKKDYLKYLQPKFLNTESFDDNNILKYKYYTCVYRIINNEEYGIELEDNVKYKRYDIKVLNKLLSLFDHCSICHLLSDSNNISKYNDDDIFDIDRSMPRYKLLMLEYCCRYYYYMYLIETWVKKIFKFYKCINKNNNSESNYDDYFIFYTRCKLYELFYIELDSQSFTNEIYFDEKKGYNTDDENYIFEKITNINTNINSIIDLVNISLSLSLDINYYKYSSYFTIKEINCNEVDIDDINYHIDYV